MRNNNLAELMINDYVVPTSTIRVETPDGTMFVHIDEDEQGHPIDVRLNIGKCGSPLMAWADCVAKMVALSLSHGASIYDVLGTIANITSDKMAFSKGIPIRSGPDGLVQAILIYLHGKDTEDYQSGKSEYRKPFIKRIETDSEG